MAEIWLYTDASGAIEDEQVDERPFEECVRLLELSADRYLGEDPTITPVEADKITVGDDYMVVAVDDEEASAMGWRPGYYPSPLQPAQALARLGIDPDDLIGA